MSLVGWAEAGGFVRRRPDGTDVRVELTSKGGRLVTDLTDAHLAELRKLAGVRRQL